MCLVVLWPLLSLVECIREEVSRPCLLPNCLSCMVSSFLAVLIFVKFADEFGASGNIETKEQGKKQNKCYNHVI